MAIWLSSEKKRSEKAEITEIEKELESIKDTHDHDQRRTDLKNRLDELYEIKHQGERIRSRTQWWEEGEKSTKYFFALEKIRAQNKLWTEIFDKNGKTVAGTANIQEVQTEFYKNLYTTQNIEENCNATSEFLRALDARISDEDKVELEKDIEYDEMENVVKKMPNNKSPGLDGLPAEFYKKYWHIIGKDIHAVITYSLDHGEMTTSQKRTGITLLYKKGERKDIKNWRPLRKINTDRKIGSKIMSNRFKKYCTNLSVTNKLV